MDHPISRAEPIRTRPLPERGQGLLPNPGVRTPTDGLLIDLGFDPPSVTPVSALAHSRLVKIAFLDWSRSLRLKCLTAEMCPSATVVRVRNMCTGGKIRGVINNIGGSRSLFITVAVQLTSIRLVMWKSVDDTHGSLSVTCM